MGESHTPVSLGSARRSPCTRSKRALSFGFNWKMWPADTWRPGADEMRSASALTALRRVILANTETPDEVRHYIEEHIVDLVLDLGVTTDTITSMLPSTSERVRPQRATARPPARMPAKVHSVP